MTQSETQIDHDSKIHRCLMYEAFFKTPIRFRYKHFPKRQAIKMAGI